MEPDIAHNRTDDSIAAKTPFFFHLQSANNHDLVAVQFISLFIDNETTVGIAVIGNPNIRPVFQNSGLNAFK